MPKTSLRKLIEKAILPVTLVVAAKLLTIFIVSLLLGTQWSVVNQHGLRLAFLNFDSPENLVVLNSLSDLLALLVSTLGLTWIIFRAHHFHEDRLHPAKAVSVQQNRQYFLVLSQENLFYEGLVWQALSWFILVIIINNVYHQATAAPMAAFALGVNLVATAAFLKEFSRSFLQASKT